MASVSSLPALPPLVTPPSTPALPVGAVAAAAAAAPVALLAGGADGPPLPFSQALSTGAGTPAQAPESGAEGTAMRPDQAIMARQMAYQQMDAAGLARAWRTQVRNHGSQLSNRALASSAGQLSPALLAAAQQGQVVGQAMRQPELLAAHPDAWRFTVHGAGQAPQHLEVLSRDPDQPPGRRRRLRAALRLALELADGSAVVVEVEPLPGGVALTLCGADVRTLTRLRWLQPEVESALGRAGLKVLRWQFRDSLPTEHSHALHTSAEAVAQALSPAVFRAVAELALLLPAVAQPAREA